MKPKLIFLIVCLFAGYLYADKHSDHFFPMKKTPESVSVKKLTGILPGLKPSDRIPVKSKNVNVLNNNRRNFLVDDAPEIKKKPARLKNHLLRPPVKQSKPEKRPTSAQLRDIKEKQYEIQSSVLPGNNSRIKQDINVTVVLIDGISYSLNDDYKATTIGNSTGYSGEIFIPDSIFYEGFFYTVTSIGASTFYNNNITSVRLPSKLISIEKYAFAYCYYLNEINFPTTLKSIASGAFNSCTSILTISIPASVNSISSSSFINCKNLGEFSVDPNNNTYSSLNGVLYDKNQTIILQYPPRNPATSYSITYSVTTIGLYAFYKCSNLKNIILPEGLTKINYAAFSGSGISSIFIPKNVGSIDDYAFNNCSNLSSVSVDSNNSTYSSENGVLFNKDKTTLLKYPVGSATTNYSIPSVTVLINSEAFENAVSLRNINIPATVTTIKEFAFAGCIGLKNISLPVSVNTIEDYAFEYCDSLTAINVDVNNADFSSVEGILYDKYQTKLILYPIGKAETSFIIPSTVKTLGAASIETCYNLKKVVIPGSVIAMGDYVFWYTENLTTLISLPITPVDLTNSSAVFYGVDYDACSLFVPSGAKTLYQNAGQWNSFTNIVELGIQPIGTIIIQDSVAYKVTSENTVEVCDEKEYSGNIIIPAEVIYAGITYTVNAIGDFAFYYSDVTSVQMPSTILTIGEFAFYYCQKLENIIIPAAVTTIKASAFRGCSSLANINIPASVSFIGDYAFRYCPKVTSFNVDNQNLYFSSVNGVLFNKSVSKLIQYPIASATINYVIPSTVDTLGLRSMANSTNLMNITIPTSVRYIMDEVFVSCGNLSGINIPASVISIGRFAFGFCANLSAFSVDGNNLNYMSDNGVLFNKDKTLLIQYPIAKPVITYKVPETVTTIGYYSFYSSTLLNEVVLPSSLLNIDAYAFYNCTDLNIIELPSSLVNIRDGAFYYAGLKSISIPEVVEIIGPYAFGSCGNLTEILVSNDNLNFSGSNGVLFDKNMSTLIQYPAGKTDSVYVIPESVNTLGEAAFENAVYPKSIIIPAGMKTMNHYALGNCTSLESLFASPETPVDLTNSYDVFWGIDKTNCVLWVPYNSLSLYQEADQWKDFENITGIYHQQSTFTIDSIHYQVSDSNTVTVTSTDGPTGLVIIPSQVSNLGKTYPVTAIGEWAFSSEKRMTGIKIPASVISIGQYAFFDCKQLQFIDVDTANVIYSSKDGVLFDKQSKTLIQYPGGKTEPLYNVPETVSTISSYSFMSNSFLTIVNIPASVSKIGIVAFIYMHNITNFNVAENNPVYSNNTDGILFNKNKTKLIQYPIGKTETSYNIPVSVETIDSAAFYGAGNLKNVTIPASVKYIEASAFVESALNQIIIPASVIVIGENALEYCYELSAIYVDSNNPNFTAKNGVLFTKDMETLILHPINSADSSYVIPSSVIKLAPSSFEENTNLKVVEIPASVTEIGDWAFWYASNIEAIYTHAIIPVNLENSSYVFQGVNDSCILYVPKGSISFYQQANQWGNFMYIIEQEWLELMSPEKGNCFLYYNRDNKSFITGELTQPSELYIYNINGQILLSKKIESREILPVSYMMEGIYLWRIYQNNNIFATGKITVN